jgi:hypothetical protein
MFFFSLRRLRGRPECRTATGETGGSRMPAAGARNGPGERPRRGRLESSEFDGFALVVNVPICCTVVYFLDVSRDIDQITAIIERAMAALAERGGVPGSDGAALEVETRELVEDLDAVLGNDPPVPAADVSAVVVAAAAGKRRGAPVRGK